LTVSNVHLPWDGVKVQLSTLLGIADSITTDSSWEKERIVGFRN
jgi:hypothetical protein